jgi:protein subunit release factor B
MAEEQINKTNLLPIQDSILVVDLDEEINKKERKERQQERNRQWKEQREIARQNHIVEITIDKIMLVLNLFYLGWKAWPY